MRTQQAMYAEERHRNRHALCVKCGDECPKSILNDDGVCPDCIATAQEQAEIEDEANRNARIQAECDASLSNAIAYGKQFDMVLRSILG